MVHPLIVIGGVVALTAVTGIGIASAVTAIDAARDDAADADLVAISLAQSAARNYTGEYLADIDDLLAGETRGVKFGGVTRVDDSRDYLVAATADEWCAATQSSSGLWLARGSAVEGAGTGETPHAAAVDASCPVLP